ncbi:MAG TPA: acyl-CoA dehydrogenase family protein, partial [Mycobacteriales bacterium]
MTAVDRLLPTEEAADLLALVREIGDAELLPRVAADERAERFPRDVFATLGKAGLLSLPFPEQYGGAAQPYEVYLQVLEEIGARWASVGVGVSVHALTLFPLLNYGTPEQRDRWLPALLAGDQLGA